MDWPFQPFILLGFFVSVLGNKCIMDECGNKYRLGMEQAQIEDPESSQMYCEILRAYMLCLDSTKTACWNNLQFRGTESIFRQQMLPKYCSRKSGSMMPVQASGNDTRRRPSTSHSNSPLPSCRYYGRNVFRHCSFFGDPHLKTFDSKYQTCRVHGTWNLIDNPYVQVKVTNEPVVEDSPATAPTKISVIVKRGSTPCTLEKRYEADSAFPLPNTFVDGTDKPGADATVTVGKSQQTDKDNSETVEIYMKYIATKMVIRRVGRYLAFSARFPEEVIRESVSYNENNIELCTGGCPVSEQLDLSSAREYNLSREQALSECRNTENLSEEIRNNLTDNYLDWCVFDLMMSGSTYDVVVGAHSAQLDALNMDPSSLQNRTQLLVWPVSNLKPNAALKLCACQLPFVLSIVLVLLEVVF